MLLIANPIAGPRHNRRLPGLLLRRLREKGLEVSLQLTEYPGHAHELAEDAVAAGEDAVLVCGGDGTVHEAACALAGTDTVLGILPHGSGNGLARHLGVPCNPLKAIEVVAKGNVRDCDWCDANGIPFFCAFGIGFEAVVAQRFSTKKRRGFSSYISSAFQVFPTYKAREYTIVTPERELQIRAMLISCCNASQYGNNAYIAPKASLFDGKMDITVVEKTTLFHYARLGVRLMTGTLRQSKGLKMLNAEEALIHRDYDGPVHADGEIINMGKEIRLKVHPAGLKIFTPSCCEKSQPG